jgi:hypothetical protein
VDERDVINAWRELFRGSETTPAILRSAEALLNRLHGESPIRFRLASELEELKKGPQNGKKKRSSGQS